MTGQLIASDAAAERADLLSTSPAGHAERRGALAVAALSLLIFLLVVPYASVPLARIDAFIPAYQAALVVCDLVTAVLLLGQFGILRSRALLALGAGYLFTALMAVAHALTFPGLFTPTGLLGAGPDTTAWIYMFWHSGFPLVVLFYALSKGDQTRTEHAGGNGSASARRDIIGAVAAAVVAAAALTTLATPGADLLPAIMSADQSGPRMAYVIYPVWSLSIVALVVLGLRRPHSVLDMWLLVVMCAWIFEIPLSAVFNAGRFTLGYYAGRVYGLLAASFILIVLLSEISALYARLARSFRTVAASLDERTANLTDAAQKLRGAKVTLDAAFKASPSAIIALDAQGLVMLWNQAAERLFGWKASEVIGNPYPVVPASERASFDASFTPALAGEEITGARGVCVTKDGRRVELSVNCAPLRGESGGQAGVFYVVTDLTDQLRIERQLQQAQKMEAVGQLTGGLAHDFNNLLAVIIGNLDLLVEAVKGKKEESEELESALGAALRGAELTRHLLAFSRRQPLQPKRIDVNTLVSNLTSMLKRTLGEQIVIETKFVADPWPAVVDPSQVESALMNMAVNARDAMPQGGRLIIETDNRTLDADYVALNPEAVQGDYVMLSVSDTGAGMPPDVLQKVFEPFFTTKGEGAGTGLGLSMVYGFVKQSGGHIKIYSELAVGTTIRLYLPRADAASDRTAEDSALDQEFPGRGEVIMVVEDKPDVRRMACRHLRELGYEVLEEEDAKSALQTLRSSRAVELLFTDVVMPGGLSGPDLAREAQKIRPGLKVLFTSGFPEAARNGGTFAPDDLLINKPYRRPDLAKKLRQALG